MHIQTNDQSRLLDTREVARMIGVTDRCLEAKRLAGRGPRYCKLDRVVRYRLADVLLWIDANTHNPEQRAA